MKRVFAIDVLACPSCGGKFEPVAEITDKRVARRMLEHVGLFGEDSTPMPARGPPQDDALGIDDDQRWPSDADA